jgi:hypothetical protein
MSIDWPIDHSAKRSVIAPDPAHSHYAESSATMAGSVITLQSRHALAHFRTRHEEN